MDYYMTFFSDFAVLSDIFSFCGQNMIELSSFMINLSIEICAF